MSGTGHGQSVKWGAVTIPGVISVKSSLKGQLLSRVVADQAYPLAASVPSAVKWTVQFELPETTPATLLAAIAKNTSATFIHDDTDGVKYEAAGAISNGYEYDSPSDGWVTYTWEVQANGAVAVTAATP